MKLKNKISGEIKEFALFDGNELQGGVTLEILTKEWEDYEEPEEYWCITGRGNLHYLQDMTDENDKDHREIGNYFETKEQAEKAVEKLKCFTNLKNHEFMFDGWYYGTDGNIVILANAHEFNDMEEQDLTKVFGEKIC